MSSGLTNQTSSGNVRNAVFKAWLPPEPAALLAALEDGHGPQAAARYLLASSSIEELASPNSIDADDVLRLYVEILGNTRQLAQTVEEYFGAELGKAPDSHFEYLEMIESLTAHMRERAFERVSRGRKNYVRPQKWQSYIANEVWQAWRDSGTKRMGRKLFAHRCQKLLKEKVLAGELSQKGVDPNVFSEHYCRRTLARFKLSGKGSTPSDNVD